MKSEAAALDLYYMAKELQGLKGAKVNKVYQKEHDFLFDLHKPGQGKKQLRIIIPRFIFITKYKPDYPESPPRFSMFLRKRLGGAVIKDVRQVGFERILEFTFEAKGENYVLVVELFSKGNMILCDSNMKIVSPLQPQSWQARTIRGGVMYDYPPEQVNTPELSLPEFKKILAESEMDSIVKALAVDFGLGGAYAEEACARAGLDKNMAPSMLPAELAGGKRSAGNPYNEFYSAVHGLFKEKIKANSVDGEVFPFRMENMGGEPDFYDSFSEAIDEVISRKLHLSKEAEAEERKSARVREAERIVKQQEDSIKKLEKDSFENQRKGELIFEKYQELNELLQDFNNDRKRMSWDELKDKYLSHPLVKQINEKQGLVVVEI